MTKITLFILNIFDKIYQKKVIKSFKKIFKNKINELADIGSHKGETINLFHKNFIIKNIYAYEASPQNFLYLKKNIKKMKLNKTRIKIYNFALGQKNEIKKFKQMSESSSSTLSNLDLNSKYFKMKNFFLNFRFNSKPFTEIYIQIKKSSHIKKKIDLLKIDTEGYEFNILKGLGKNIKDIRVIFFEHHYDKMILKNYTFGDINKYLTNNKFKRYAKFKMPFRKSFEYIYINERFFI